MDFSDFSFLTFEPEMCQYPQIKVCPQGQNLSITLSVYYSQVRNFLVLFFNLVTLVLGWNCAKVLRVTKLSNKSNLKRSGVSSKQKTNFIDNHGQKTLKKLYFSFEIWHYRDFSTFLRFYDIFKADFGTFLELYLL